MQAFGPVLYRIFEILDIFDMYNSWWFRMLLMLVTLNIIVCSLDRLSATWKIIFPPNPRYNPTRFKNTKRKTVFDDPRSPDQIKPECQRLASRLFSYQDEVSTEDGFALYAEKWRWTRLGVYIVHSSVVLLLLGGLIGSIFGFEGFVNIAEGESTNVIRLRNTGQPFKLDFSIRCDDFDVSFYPNGAPKEFRSSLSILKDEKEVYNKDIIVNDPLRFNGINIFQSSYGELPPQAGASGAPSKFTLNFTSKETGMVYRQEAGFNQTIDIPENLGQLVIETYRPNYNFRGTDLGGTLVGSLTQADGKKVEILLPLRFPSFDKMSPMMNKDRSNAVFISVVEHDAGAVQAEKRYYTGLQVTQDPGVWLVYVGFVAMILGCIVTFFMSHQQVYLQVSDHAGGSRIQISGTSNKHKTGLERKLNRIKDKIAEATTAKDAK
jgi:cytochrome c biogenesis protein